MDNKILERARQLVKRGYSVLPTDKDKNPIVKNWSRWQTVPMTLEEVDKYFNKAYGVAILGGGSKAISIIDWDLKYDLSGDLYERALSEVPASIFKKMLINETVNGGKHWIFSCETGLGNVKLAQRGTTDKEVEETYVKNMDSGAIEAMKIALNDKVRVLIETRSFSSIVRSSGALERKSDGYACFPPTPGYKFVEGSVGTITNEELEQLLTVLRSYNLYTPPKVAVKNASLGTDIWDKANNSIDSLKLLTDCGWRIVYDGENDVRLLRPGQVSSTTSAIYHRDTKCFVCFSSSTVFEPGKGYSPASLFIELECEGDVFEAKAKLTEQLM